MGIALVHMDKLLENKCTWLYVILYFARILLHIVMIEDLSYNSCLWIINDPKISSSSFRKNLPGDSILKKSLIWRFELVLKCFNIKLHMQLILCRLEFVWNCEQVTDICMFVRYTFNLFLWWHRSPTTYTFPAGQDMPMLEILRLF